MSAANLKQHINLYFNPDSVPVSTSGKLTRPTLPLLPFSLLAAPAKTLSFHQVLSTMVMSTDVSQVSVALFPSF